ncbi:MAG TPA: TIGR03862 family flavoprotein [Flavobacteriales bacterium]|nr:TIGR03862 family flavoprotein [Flavobacteriales bacterium]HQV74603.1 TIGR03862 family flavoprotein [Flavobacteriales bacterium]HQW40322.1 TIGR03862 family flavoprotein [Flavobacteriales bacterium]
MHVAIIGGGPAGMIAADRLADTCEVHLYEQGRTLGRKFLVAGEGGLNITNSAEDFLQHFTPSDRMRDAVREFDPAALRTWLSELGIPTYVGSSGRVFPERGIKPAEVLKAIMERLKKKGVHIHMQHSFVGFDEKVRPVFEHQGSRISVDADRTLFALGGASWAKTGSTGEWLAYFESIGLRTVPFQASNCGVEVDLPEAMSVHAGKPLKNISITVGERTIRGEATITEYGLEGNAIYPIVPLIRAQLQNGGTAELILDLKPDSTLDELRAKYQDSSWNERMAALNMDRASVALVKAFTPKERYLAGYLAEDIKALRLSISKLRPIEEAISTVGGIAMEEVAEDFSLIKHPHLYVAGEMLDWDAPTGGFLLQGAFSTGYAAAQAINSAAL